MLQLGEPFKALLDTEDTEDTEDC